MLTNLKHILTKGNDYLCTNHFSYITSTELRTGLLAKEDTYIISKEDPIIVVVANRVDPRVAHEMYSALLWEPFQRQGLQKEF